MTREFARPPPSALSSIVIDDETRGQFDGVGRINGPQVF
jgi:hypothetical protein